MEKYSEHINNLYNSIVASIQKLPENNNSLLDDFLLDLYNYVRNTNLVINEFEATNKSLNEQYRKKTETFNPQYDFIKSKFEKQLIEIEKNSANTINKIKERFEELEVESEKLNKIINDEQMKLIKDTNTTIYNRLLKKNQKNHLLDVHKNSIIKKYNERIGLLNNTAASKKQNLFAANNKSLFRYNKANDALIEQFSSKINANDEKIEVLNAELQEHKTVLTDQIKEIEIKFNKYVASKNKDLQTVLNADKFQYQLEMTSYTEDIKKIKQEYSLEKSAVLKDFIAKLEDINNEITAENELYTEIINSLSKNHLFIMQDLEQQKNEINDIFNFSNKEATDVLRYKEDGKKIELKIANELRNFKDNSSSNLNNHEKQMAILKNKKSDLEKKKDYQIEIIELSENLEAEKVELKRNTSTLEYDKNTLKLNHKFYLDIENYRKKCNEEKISINKVYKENEYKISKSIDAFNFNNALINLELDFTKSMEELVEKKENVVTNNNINTATICSILNIEKNNYLKNYNLFLVDNSIKKNNCLYLYEEQKLNSIKDKKIDFFKLQLDKDLFSKEHIKKISAYEIEFEMIRERTNKYLENLEYNISYSQIKNNLSQIKYNDEEVKLRNISEFTSKAINLLDAILINFIIQMYNINSRPSENLLILSDKIIFEIISFKNNILNISKDKYVNLLNEQILFDTGEKYQLLSKSLKDNHDAITSKYNAKNLSLKDTISNYKTALKAFYQKTILLENKKMLLEKKLELKRFDLFERINIKKEISALNFQLKDTRIKILKNEKMILLLEKDLTKNNYLLLKNGEDFIKQNEELNRNQKSESRVYFKGIKNIKLITSATLERNNTFLNFFENLKSIKLSKITARIKNVKYFRKIHFIIDRLRIELDKNYIRTKKNNTLLGIRNKRQITNLFKKNEKEYLYKVNLQNNKYGNLIKENEILKNKLKIKYKNIEKSNKAFLNNSLRILRTNNENEYKNFQILTIANEDNILYTLRANKAKNIKVDKIYKIDFKATVDKFNKLKASNNQSLKNSNKKYLDYLNYLPELYQNSISKNNENYINLEFKINQELSEDQRERKLQGIELRNNYQMLIFKSNARIKKLNSFIENKKFK